MVIKLPELSNYTLIDFSILLIICFVEFMVLYKIFKIILKFKLKKQIRETDEKLKTIFGIDNVKS